MDIGRFDLESHRIGLRQSLSREFFEDVRVSQDEVMGMIIIDAFKRIIMHKCGDRIIRHPMDWKESLKDRWLPAWAKKRWPIRFKEYDALVIFPEFLAHHPVPQSLRGENFYITYMESGKY